MGMMRGLSPHVHSVGDSVGPEARRSAAGHQVGSREFHYTADGSLGDPVQLMDVRGTRGGVYTFSRE
eukprot:3306456-Pleurochrysis_carterae.AAC.1